MIEDKVENKQILYEAKKYMELLFYLHRSVGGCCGSLSISFPRSPPQPAGAFWNFKIK